MKIYDKENYIHLIRQIAVLLSKEIETKYMF